MPAPKRFHLSPNTNKEEVCQGVCRFGGDTPHFDTREEARAHIVEDAAARDSGKALAGTRKATARKATAKTASAAS